MEQKMKRIPFDLELAKQGVSFYINRNYKEVEVYYFADLNDDIFYRWEEDGIIEWDVDIKQKDWYMIVPDEPKPERWAVVYNMCIFSTEDEADKCIEDRYNPASYTAVKLAD